ncbi:histone H1-like [Rhinichthys klamathensis goyatoka]|uniref:histone H1-like n=1 Tax=Rhinichthys klamathensis goyatoka TaxID=3034132 RepID=UPI0024B4D8C9|nr:histone H1-like [Rhinichthys klamathensis goyatoka]
MAETAPAKSPKKKSAVKAKKAGPGVGDLIVKAVSASKERSGVSLAALKKAVAAGGYDVEKNNSRVKTAIKSLVTKGTLLQVKGTGASGSFKLNKQQAETKKKAAPKVKKPAAKKPAAAKKPKTAAAKKPVAKKSPKKVKKPAAKKTTKSPKKAKKPATPKKAAKSPKKAKAAKPKAAKPKAAKPKAAKPKKAAPKKK